MALSWRQSLSRLRAEILWWEYLTFSFGWFMNSSDEKPVCGLSSWGKDVVLGHFTFLSLGLHFENLISPKSTSAHPGSKSGLCRSTESPGDVFPCARKVQGYQHKDPDCPAQNEGACARAWSAGGGGSLSSAQAGLQAIFPCGLAGWFLVICFAVVTDHVVFHAPCVSGKCHHCWREESGEGYC